MSEEESSSYSAVLPVTTPESEQPKNCSFCLWIWVTMWASAFLFALFVIGYVSFTESHKETQFDLALWLQIFAVTDALFVLATAWLTMKKSSTLSAEFKVAGIRLAVEIVSIVFSIAWTIVGIVLLVENFKNSALVILSIVFILSYWIRIGASCAAVALFNNRDD